MKAAVKKEPGPGRIEILDVPVPEIGDDDVLLEIKAAGLCGSDLAFAEGDHADILFPPVILGHEFSGIVSKAGKNVTEWREGDRVVSENTGKICGKCYACMTADYLSCPSRLGLGYGMDGGFARYCKIHGETLKRFSNSLIRIPDEMSFEEAAILDPACNAYMAVVQEGKLLAGEDVVVFGVGALGQFSIEAARAAGASRIIAVGLAPDKDRFELAKVHGATDFIFADKSDPVNEVKKITDGEGAALAVDCAGANAVLRQAFFIVRTKGVIVKIGYDRAPFDCSLDDLVGRAVSVKGHFGYDSVSWRNVIKLFKAGKFSLKTVITHKFKISQINEALELLRRREAVKIILYPED